MAKFNADEQTQLVEPIEITIGGKTYVIEKLSMALMEKVEELGQKPSMEAAVQQFCLLTGADPKDMAGVDIRKIAGALDFITNTVKAGLASKNV